MPHMAKMGRAGKSQAKLQPGVATCLTWLVTLTLKLEPSLNLFQ